MYNIIAKTRKELRNWLLNNCDKEKECYVQLKTNNVFDSRCTLTYIEAVYEAICFGWIDSIRKKDKLGNLIQRFSPRINNSLWTELNKARAEKLIKDKLMCKQGLIEYKKSQKFYIDEDIKKAFDKNKKAWSNFKKFPELYKRVRIDTIQRYKKNKKQFDYRLSKLIENSENNKMYGVWNDSGILLNI